MLWVVFFLITLTCVRTAIYVAEKNAETPSARLRVAGEALESLIVAVAIVFLLVRPFVVQAFFIPSGSMRPTLKEEDRVLVDKLRYRLAEPRRHEVVVFRAPHEALIDDSDGDERDFIKRVIGLPGDTVEIHEGTVYVNGRAEDDACQTERPDYYLPPTQVPPGKLFVMGDNRNHSNDSHRWGALDRDRLIGKAILVFWPPTRAGVIR